VQEIIESQTDHHAIALQPSTHTRRVTERSIVLSEPIIEMLMMLFMGLDEVKSFARILFSATFGYHYYTLL
jgi:hypothetical protein